MFIALMRLASFTVCYHFQPLRYLFLHSFKHCFRSNTISLFNSQKFIDFVFIWVYGLHSLPQNLKNFFSHHLVMFEYDFHTLWHSKQALVSWLACTMISLTFFNTLWYSWYTFRLSTNRLCVLFTMRLPGSPILYPRLCCSSTHTSISLIQNPSGE